MDYKEILLKIKPKVDKQSDKHSWQLYQFIKRHKNCAENVYLQINDTNNGELSNARLGDIIIGHKTYDGTDIIGNSLGSILSPSRDKYKTNCYMNYRLGWNLKEITDEFWEQYIKDGRCCLDRSHKGWWSGGGDCERYTTIDDSTRKCNWCGVIEKKETYIYTEERTRWNIEK